NNAPKIRVQWDQSHDSIPRLHHTVNLSILYFHFLPSLYHKQIFQLDMWVKLQQEHTLSNTHYSHQSGNPYPNHLLVTSASKVHLPHFWHTTSTLPHAINYQFLKPTAVLFHFHLCSILQRPITLEPKKQFLPNRHRYLFG